MTNEEAEAIVGQVLDPLPLETFRAALGKHPLTSPAGANAARAGLFGDDPVQTALDAFATHAATLDCHAVAPSGPPPAAAAVPDAPAFEALVRAYHARDYTVRLPEVTALARPLARFARALSVILRQPVDASLFWSKPGAGAIVHFDRRDNIVVQLRGRKRWFVSTDAPALPNAWPNPDEAPADIARRETVDLGPGDLLYLPRGTAHSVAGEDESLHLAILFVPGTVRDALMAAIDLLADYDRTFRETLPLGGDAVAPDTAARVMEGAAQLLRQCGQKGFVETALAHRWARLLGDMPALAGDRGTAAETVPAWVRHADGAAFEVFRGRERIDFAAPGTHIATHPGVEEELRFIAETSEFAPDRIAGSSTPEIKRALVARLMAEGLLVPGGAPASPG